MSLFGDAKEKSRGSKNIWIVIILRERNLLGATVNILFSSQ